jgi:LytS/YehU family sensor histidine kinase
MSTAIFFSVLIALVYNVQGVRIARLRLESEMTDASLRSLRSQMKPHFLSNILNSMYYFILNEKPEESGTFVSSFSRLVRHMLESSDKNYLPIPGELSQVQDYVAFECRRADRKVDLNVHFQKDADFSSVLIPSMLMQPILENCLMHGLFPLRGHKGQIDIRLGLVDSPDFRYFTADGIRISRHGRLLVQVLDNGQGREASRKALDKRFTQSFAMRVIEKRLHWIERKFHVRAEMVVTDLKKTDGSAAGTAVTFNLPLMEKVSPEAGIYPVKSERLLSGRA